MRGYCVVDRRVGLKLVQPVEPPAIYIVDDDFGEIGRCYRETESAVADLESTIHDLISGQ